jgi:hypothetical protein
MQTQFWVIGGDYRDHSFTHVIDGTLQVAGPFADRAEATRVWREHAHASRYRATTRYTIAASAGSADLGGK